MRGWQRAAFVASPTKPRRVLEMLRAKSRGIDQLPHHIRPNCRQSELRSLLFREIENALAKLVKYAAVMCQPFHRAGFYHYPVIAQFAAYWA